MICKKRVLSLLLLAAALLAAAATFFIYGVYHGILLLNNPSRGRYPIRGVDVSHYQGEIDWQVLGAQPIRFAYIKATEGSSHVDDKFAYNWARVQETSLEAGAYHFFSFESPGETQLSNFTSQVAAFEGMLPPAVDVEFYGGFGQNPPDAQQIREQLAVLLDGLEQAYHVIPVIYATEEAWEYFLRGYFDDYPLWIRNVKTRPRIDADWTFWQYTNRERLDGYSGDEEFIDMNVFFGSEAQWEAWLK